MMKKIFFILAAMMLSANAANAQLSNVLGNLASKVQSTTANSNNSVLSTIGGLISSKLIPTDMQIQGTWAYQKPAIMFTSSNALKSVANKAITTTAENKLQTYLSKVGIREGKLRMVFNADKTFSVENNGKKLASGTYTLNNSEVTLTFKGRKNPCKVTPQLESGTLVIVMDATKLKTFFENIGSNVSALSSVVTYLKNVDGLKIGLRMSK